MEERLKTLVTGDSLRARLLRGGLGSIGVKVLGLVLSLILSVFLARILGAEKYGIYAFSFSVISIIAIPVKLGLPQLVLRETVKAHSLAKWGLIRGIWKWSNIMTSIFSVLVILLTLGILFIWEESLDEPLRAVLMVGIFLVPLIALSNIRDASIKGLKYVVQGQLSETIIRPLFFIIALFILYSNVDEMTPVYAMGCHILASILAFICGLSILKRVRPSALKANPKCEYKTGPWFASALPLAFISGMQVVNTQIDIIMLGYFSSSEDVGVYKVVVTGATLVSFGLQAINMVVAPYFASLNASGRKDKLQKLVTQSSRASTLLAIPVVLIIGFWGESLLGLIFGREYSAGYIPIFILSIGQLFNACVGSVALLLNMTGNEKHTIRGLVVAVIFNIILNLTLIPLMGVEGAALATALTLFTWNILLRRSVKKVLDIETLAIKIA